MSPPLLSSPTAPPPDTASEHSLYYDAPIMHIFTRNNEDGETVDDSILPTADTDHNVAPKADQPQDGEQADLDRPSSVSIAPNPVIATDKGSASTSDTSGDVNDEQLPVGSKSSAAAASTTSDSGYASSAGAKDKQSSTSRSPRTSTDMKPIPILWTDNAQNPRRNGVVDSNAPQGTDENADVDEDFPMDEPSRHGRTRSISRRTGSLRSFRSATSRGRSHDRADFESGRSTSASRFSERRRHFSLSGGTFAEGPGTIGPSATPQPDDTHSFVERSKVAEAGLTPKQRSRIGKAHAKVGKQISKVLKSEGKVERKALEQAIKELADIQKMQKNAVREESRAVSAHAKALRTFHKEELEHLAAKARFDRAQAELWTYEDARETARDHAADITDMLKEKNLEVEWLRAQKAADDSEREAKMQQLTGKP
ncbi:uncharacterized protein LAESUDRAFT_677672 [Laetiporus sulphureus 93-53]|uniref:Uncharacterized protein n=1 Tax=Laetiporus sulphureus 93-53 TaxID=1314785 RepID=A0A165EU56_9APHY|nr:uncharacterized protein LAESUDRAFT_677672 [Laetiporus sulphureus 93-53]KZT07768.1 hypothetical protein LAESUDRAFT_677672 [Laetiporus sulphureus 93-53]